jgi:hypothetical protein
MQVSMHAVEALWSFHPVIEICLAVIMYRRKVHRQYPIFFAYILFQVMQFAILFPIYLSQGVSGSYWFAYWAAAVISWVFGFKIIQEVFFEILRPFPALQGAGGVMFRWVTTTTALSMFLLIAAVPSNSPSAGLLIYAERFARFAQCALILFILMFARFIRVSWRQPSIGIVLGYGSFAGVEIFVFLLYSGRVVDRVVLDLVNAVAYNLTLVVWTAYIAFPAPNPSPGLRTGPNVPVIDAGTV